MGVGGRERVREEPFDVDLKKRNLVDHVKRSTVELDLLVGSEV